MTVVEIGPDRLAKLREVLGDMDEALRDEGFDALGSHAVYVRWQRACVEALGTILVEAERELGARVERACEMIEESSRKFRDDEARRVELLLESGRVAINLAREANRDRARHSRLVRSRSSTSRSAGSPRKCRGASGGKPEVAGLEADGAESS